MSDTAWIIAALITWGAIGHLLLAVVIVGGRDPGFKVGRERVES